MSLHKLSNVVPAGAWTPVCNSITNIFVSKPETTQRHKWNCDLNIIFHSVLSYYTVHKVPHATSMQLQTFYFARDGIIFNNGNVIFFPLAVVSFMHSLKAAACIHGLSFFKNFPK